MEFLSEEEIQEIQELGGVVLNETKSLESIIDDIKELQSKLSAAVDDEKKTAFIDTHQKMKKLAGRPTTIALLSKPENANKIKSLQDKGRTIYAKAKKLGWDVRMHKIAKNEQEQKMKAAGDKFKKEASKEQASINFPEVKSKIKKILDDAGIKKSMTAIDDFIH